MPTLIIDADACPVTREALACAREARVPVLIAGNSTQNLARRIRRDDPRDAEHARGRDGSHPGLLAEILDVSCGADSADFAIVERLQPGDVVVTQDIAARQHGARTRRRRHRRARARLQQGDHRYAALHSPRGEEGPPRRRTHAGPAAFTDDDRERFRRNLAQLLRDALGG